MPAEKKHGISGETLYTSKRKFGGMDVEDARRSKALEAENAKLKELLAERMLDIEVLKGIHSEDGERARSSAAARSRAVAVVHVEAVSLRAPRVDRACASSIRSTPTRCRRRRLRP